MENVLSNSFAFFMLLYAMLMLITGIIFKVFPPKKLRWYNSIPFPSSWQYNKAVQLEAMQWSIKPALLMAVFFIGLAFLALVLPWSPFFTFGSAFFLTSVCSVILISLRKRHLKRLFDEDGNLRRND